ncbi:Threonine/homoserine/homoserine lactone efflux protein [Maribacter sedimenticola]|uniref:Threonine/homoserine/homoserine lactone efflux protein n=1 Tax=Maribacter sedimenticola TaxID=228956 RepID=A0ABY1SHY1_9FLAO|nr:MULTISPECIES: LysE family transporter [Maribacter]TVZ15735.1 threonine/homoserine/homoserine lactone efflux protein [Maribacter sp. MAR_2009_72]SNR55751.1 Threonine/homoserine/homoserine lactone efflux protein [Maribacter sedimenticola]
MQQLPTLFVFTFAAAFLASLPPGLLNLNAAKTSVEKGKANGLIFALGVAIAVMLQTYIAVRIAKLISRNQHVVELLLQTALLVFFILAIFFFIKGRKQVNRPFIITDAKKRNSFSKGIFLALINLLAIPYYSGLNTVFHSQGFMTYMIMDEVLFILAAGSGTFWAMYLYVIYFKKWEHKTTAFTKNSNYILSGLMVLLFIITCLRLFN